MRSRRGGHALRLLIAPCCVLACTLGVPRRAVASPLDDARARTHAGMTAFAAGDYTAAERAFAEAYAIAPEPALLYDLARCRAALGRDRDAAETFERFARLSADEGERAEALAQAVEARRRWAEHSARRRYPYPAATALGVLSLASLASSVATGAVAKQAYDSLADACAMGCPADRDAQARRGEQLRIASIVTLAVGGGLGVAGAVAVGLEWRRAARNRK